MRAPAAITPYRAILLSYDFFQAADTDGLCAARALQQVVAEDPGCGLA